jgi:hypothetical protein
MRRDDGIMEMKQVYFLLFFAKSAMDKVTVAIDHTERSF